MGSYFLRHLPSPLFALTQAHIQTKMKLLKFLLPLLLVASVSSFSIKSLFSHEDKSEELPAEDSVVDEDEEEDELSSLEEEDGENEDEELYEEEVIDVVALEAEEEEYYDDDYYYDSEFDDEE